MRRGIPTKNFLIFAMKNFLILPLKNWPKNNEPAYFAYPTTQLKVCVRTCIVNARSDTDFEFGAGYAETCRFDIYWPTSGQGVKGCGCYEADKRNLCAKRIRSKAEKIYKQPLGNFFPFEHSQSKSFLGVRP